jgi:hypothetical protein
MLSVVATEDGTVKDAGVSKPDRRIIRVVHAVDRKPTITPLFTSLAI